MPFKKFKKLVTSDASVSDANNISRVINQLQSNIQDSFAPLTSNIQNDSTLLQSISLTAGKVNTINHLLNRNLTGWKLIRIRSNSIVWDSQDTNPNPSQTLLLNCSANCVVDLEVF